MLRITRRRLAAGAVAMAVPAAALTTAATPASASLATGCAQSSVPGLAQGLPAVPTVVCTGTSTAGNGAWRVEIPYGYANAVPTGPSTSTPATKTLLLWSHGFRAAYDTNHTADTYPKGNTGYGYDLVTRYLLLSQGYALAGSAYGRNGWAVNDGVKADVELLQTIAPAHLPVAPVRTYAWGESLGGLITEMLAETHPSLVTAANPECGVMGGSLPLSDHFLDAEVAAKTFFYPALRLSGYTSDADAAAQFTAVQNAVVAKLSSPTTQAATLARLIGLDVLMGLPLKTEYFNDQHSQASLANAAVQAFLTQVGYGIRGLRDVVARTGGVPAGNIGVDYRTFATTAAQNRFAAYGFSPSLLKAYAQTLQTYGTRITPSSTARTRFAAMGMPTGNLAVKTLTTHTAYDPLVLVQNETLFAHRVAAKGKTALLSQVFVNPPAGGGWGLNSTSLGAGETPALYGAGHCNFSPVHELASVKALDYWVATGQKPGAATFKAIATQIQNLIGNPLLGDPAGAVATSYTALPWPRPGVS